MKAKLKNLSKRSLRKMLPNREAEKKNEPEKAQQQPPKKKVSEREKKNEPEKQQEPAGGQKKKKKKDGGGKKTEKKSGRRGGKKKGKLSQLLKRKKNEGRRGEGSSSSSSSSSSGDPKDVSWMIGEDNPLLARSQKNMQLPGAVRSVIQVENHVSRLLAEERPDMDTSQLTEREAIVLDNYIKEKTQLIAGDCLYTEDNNDEEKRTFTRYEIRVKYNVGRYSAIYLATRTRCFKNQLDTDELPYLVKLALRKNSARSTARLRKEGKILLEVGNKRLDAKKLLFTPIQIDQGRICDLPYLVMNYLDRDLAKIREDCGGKFGRPTAIHAAIECLNAMADFHGKGYIHRDIKPTNFCSGFDDLSHKLFIIDFGDAVKKTDQKPPSLGVPDGLTLPYWSLEAHSDGTGSMRGDMESWFYLAVELIEPKAFDWARETKVAGSAEKKKKFWKDYKKTLETRALSHIAEFLVEKKEIDFPKDHMAVKQKLIEMLDGLTKGKVVVEWVKPPPPPTVKKPRTKKPVSSSISNTTSTMKVSPRGVEEGGTASTTKN